MKKITSILIALLLSCTMITEAQTEESVSYDELILTENTIEKEYTDEFESFSFTWECCGESANEFAILTRPANGNIKIDWGDGTEQTYYISEGSVQIEKNYDTGSGNVFTVVVSALDTNTHFFQIVFYRNKVSMVNVTGLSFLTSISCNNNELTDIDLSTNSKFRVLSCNNNKLTNINLGDSDDFKLLFCSNNQLVNLTINPALSILHCYNNLLTHLDLSNNTDMAYLYCSHNRLTTLDFHDITSIYVLDCFDNQLTEIIYNNPLSNLSGFNCHNNCLKLSTLYNLSQFPQDSSKRKPGTQRWIENLDPNSSFSLSGEMVLNDIQTQFVIMKDSTDVAVEGIDYLINYDAETITFLTIGIFEVTMTNDAIVCHADYPAKIIAKFYVGVSSINENDKTVLSVYPNPVSDKVYVKSEKLINTIQLYDINGRVLLSIDRINQLEAEIDLSDFPNGIYFLKVDETTAKTIKISQ